MVIHFIYLNFLEVRPQILMVTTNKNVIQLFKIAILLVLTLQISTKIIVILKIKTVTEKPQGIHQVQLYDNMVRLIQILDLIFMEHRLNLVLDTNRVLEYIASMQNVTLKQKTASL